MPTANAQGGTSMARFQGRNLRRGRASIPNQIYLITTVTADRRPFFSDWMLGRVLVKALRMSRAETLSFVVMPDHLHWLLQLPEKTDLSQIVRAAKLTSARWVNCRLGRTGSVWQAGFHDYALRDEQELLPTARYIVANPLRAGIVGSAGDYPLWDAIWL